MLVLSLECELHNKVGVRTKKSSDRQVLSFWKEYCRFNWNFDFSNPTLEKPKSRCGKWSIEVYVSSECNFQMNF